MWKSIKINVAFAAKTHFVDKTIFCFPHGYTQKKNRHFFKQSGA